MRIYQWLLIFVLLGGIFYFGLMSYENVEMIRKGISVTDSKMQPRKSSELEVPSVDLKNPPETSYEDIVNMNLFSADRKPPVMEVESEPETVTEVKQRPVAVTNVQLYGIISSPGHEAALIKNPDYVPGLEKEFLWIKTGEQVGGYLVSGIESEGILLKEGSKRIRISLYDGKKDRKTHERKIETKPTIVKAGPEKKIEATAAAETVPKRRGYVNPFLRKP